MKLTNCMALASDGAWFTSLENLQAFNRANPGIFTVKVGDSATILNRRLISVGTTGKIIGFDRNNAGTVLVMIKWHKDAAPLRVKIEAIMPNPPAKFWMVVPYNERVNGQASSYSGEARRMGMSPAVSRFSSRQAAEDYITRERAATRWQEYIILEPVTYRNGDVVVPM